MWTTCGPAICWILLAVLYGLVPQISPSSQPEGSGLDRARRRPEALPPKRGRASLRRMGDASERKSPDGVACHVLCLQVRTLLTDRRREREGNGRTGKSRE